MRAGAHLLGRCERCDHALTATTVAVHAVHPTAVEEPGTVFTAQHGGLDEQDRAARQHRMEVDAAPARVLVVFVAGALGARFRICGT